jgi:hypothetical protein
MPGEMNTYSKEENDESQQRQPFGVGDAPNNTVAASLVQILRRLSVAEFEW